MTTPDPLIGTTVGHYRIQLLLGGGGMGVVYQAEDIKLGRKVALKFLPPQLGQNPDAKERFYLEARSAATLDHPNICTIYEVGETDDGQIYLAMACYEGITLKRRISHGRLSFREAVDIARQVTEGLAESHGRDIIHRDIKPANVYLTLSGTVKILDFGLAKVMGQTDLTRTGSSMGTPTYMSPEHARGEKVDVRTDLWSLGVLLFEMLAGKAPFRGSSIPAIIFSIFSDETPDIRKYRKDVPEELVAILERLLAKNRRDRYGTCQELLRDLAVVPLPDEPLASEPQTMGVPPAPPSPPVSLHAASQAVSTTAATGLSPSYLSEVALDAPTIAHSGGHNTETAEVVDSQGAPSIQADTHDGTGEEVFERRLAQGLEAALARNYPRAEKAFEDALALRPDDSRVKFNLQRVRQRLNERSRTTP